MEIGSLKQEDFEPSSVKDSWIFDHSGYNKLDNAEGDNKDAYYKLSEMLVYLIIDFAARELIDEEILYPSDENLNLTVYWVTQNLIEYYNNEKFLQHYSRIGDLNPITILSSAIANNIILWRDYSDPDDFSEEDEDFGGESKDCKAVTSQSESDSSFELECICAPPLSKEEEYRIQYIFAPALVSVAIPAAAIVADQMLGMWEYRKRKQELAIYQEKKWQLEQRLN